jgi:hypothetical protein
MTALNMNSMILLRFHSDDEAWLTGLLITEFVKDNENKMIGHRRYTDGGIWKMMFALRF